MMDGARLEGWPSIPWFETRGFAALLTMRAHLKRRWPSAKLVS
jgi:hypothetical protein